MGNKTEKDTIIQALSEPAGPIVSSTKVKAIKIEGHAGAKTIDYKDIKLKSWDIKHELPKWTNRDFAIFIRDRFFEKYHKDWGINIVGVIPYLNRVKDKISEIMGFCDNIVFRDYIDFYLDRWCDHFMAGYEFSLHPMRFKEPISDFIEKYNYKGSVHKTVQTVSKDTVKITNKEIENAYLLGEDAFLLSCGIVLSVNWLICKKGIDQEDACRYVMDILKRAILKKNISAIVDVTCKYSPYPKWFPFRDAFAITEQSGVDTYSNLVKIEYIENSDFCF